MNAQDKLVDELQKNEHIVQIVSLEDLKKEWIARKSDIKTASGYVSPIKDSVGVAKLLRDFGFQANKVLIKQYAGKEYVIFKGYPGMRKIFRGTRYLTTNPKVVRLAVGPRGIIKSVRGGFVLTVVLSVGIEIFDCFIKDTTTVAQFLGNVTSDLIKIGVSSIAGAVAGLAVGSAAVIGSIAAAPIIAAIAVGILTGYVLDKIDAKVGATAALIKAYEKLGIKLREIEYNAAWWYNYFNTNPRAIMSLFGSSGGYYYGGY